MKTRCDVMWWVEVWMKSWIRSRESGQMSSSYVRRTEHGWWRVVKGGEDGDRRRKVEKFGEMRRKGLKGLRWRGDEPWMMTFLALPSSDSRLRGGSRHVCNIRQMLLTKDPASSCCSTSPPPPPPLPGGQQNIWAGNTNQIKTNCGIERFIKFEPVRVSTRADAKWKIQFVATPRSSGTLRKKNAINVRYIMRLYSF